MIAAVGCPRNCEDFFRFGSPGESPLVVDAKVLTIRIKDWTSWMMNGDSNVKE